jgi:hypothetical protein
VKLLRRNASVMHAYFMTTEADVPAAAKPVGERTDQQETSQWTPVLPVGPAGCKVLSSVLFAGIGARRTCERPMYLAVDG